MRGRVLRIQLQRLLEIALRSQPIPVVSKPYKRARRVSFSQLRIGIDCLLRRRLRLRHFINRPDHTDVAKQRIRISEPGKRERERRILLFRASEEVDSVWESLFVSLIPELSTFVIS